MSAWAQGKYGLHASVFGYSGGICSPLRNAAKPLYLAAGFVLWFSSLLVFSYLWNVAGLVFKCALYVYAATGAPPAPFTRDAMGAAWKTR